MTLDFVLTQCQGCPTNMWVPNSTLGFPAIHTAPGHGLHRPAWDAFGRQPQTPCSRMRRTGRAPGELLKAWKNRGCGFPLDLGRELAQWGKQETAVPRATSTRATSSLYPEGIPSKGWEPQASLPPHQVNDPWWGLPEWEGPWAACPPLP